MSQTTDSQVADQSQAEGEKDDGKEDEDEDEDVDDSLKPNWSKFEDGAAIMEVDVESVEPQFNYTCKLSLFIHIYICFNDIYTLD